MGVTTYMHVTKGMGGKHEMRAGLMPDPDNLGDVRIGDDGQWYLN